MRLRILLWTACVFAGTLELVARLEDPFTLREVFRETFDDNSRGWTGVAESGDAEAATLDGVLRWRSTSYSSDKPALRLRISNRRDFEIAVDAWMEEENPEAYFALKIGHDPETRDEYSFGIGGDGECRFGRRVGGTFETLGEAVKPPFVDPTKPTRLAVRRIGDRLFFFANGRVVNVAPFEGLSGDRVMLHRFSDGVVLFDNLTIRYLRADDETSAAMAKRYAASVGEADTIFLPLPETRDAVDETVVAAAESDPPQADEEATPDQVSQWMQEATELSNAYQHSDSAALARRVIARQPENPGAHIQLSWSKLMLGDLDTARRHAEIARMVDPAGLAAWVMTAYVAAADGELAEAKRIMKSGLFFDVHGASLENLRLDADELIQRGSVSGSLPAFKDDLDALFANRPTGYAPIAAQIDSYWEAVGQSDWDTVEKRANAVVDAMEQLPSDYRYLAADYAALFGWSLFSSDDFRRAGPLLERGLALAGEHGNRMSGFTQLLLAEHLSNYYLSIADAEKVEDIVTRFRSAVEALPATFDERKAKLQLTFCQSLYDLGRLERLQQEAARLREQSKDWSDPLYAARAHNLLALAYSETTTPQGRRAYADNLRKAIELAESGGYEEIVQAATENLAIRHYQQGESEKAKAIYRERLAALDHAARPMDAEALLNNLGAILYYESDYDGAAEAFERAVALNEGYRERIEDESERMRFLATKTSPYYFLAWCYAELGDSAKLFRTQSRMKARLLADRLAIKEDAPEVSLSAFQATLGPDEAALYYTVPTGGEVVIHAITRESSHAVAQQDFRRFVALKAKYLDRLTSSRNREGYKPVDTEYLKAKGLNEQSLSSQVSYDDFEAMVEMLRGLIDGKIEVDDATRATILNEFLAAYHDFLVAPVASRLADKKRLVVFPSRILYFLPFEALRDGNGSYLVEDYDLRYGQSAQTQALLRERQYPNDRKSFLGMGGAIYERMTEAGAAPLQTRSRLVELQAQARANIVAGAPQREVYAQLFGGEPMSYLEGSRIEIETLGKGLPGATYFLGKDMTEQRIKTMSRSGQLANFRVVHLATHGFSLPQIPQLSGVAMSIFEEMRGNEDGYLTAPEIARLGMKADMAVLSACDTGLGRIYGGEGVEGLTGSLLRGGANRALVSLWPVSDAGTMRFMVEVYKRVFGEGAPWDAAVNATKRDFIEGKFGTSFQDPRIWAPFIQYGL